MSYCAKSGCHKPSTLFPKGVADLNLMPDELLIARILDVPATHADITCESGVGECLPATCPPSGTTLLVNRSDPTDSWMLQKMAPFMPGSNTNTDIGCGDDMPSTNTTFSTPYSAPAKACLEELFLTIAETGTPCSLPSDGG